MEAEMKTTTTIESINVKMGEEEQCLENTMANKIIAKDMLRMRYAVSTRSNLMKDSSKRIRRAISMKHSTCIWKCPRCPLSFSSSGSLIFHQRKAKHYTTKRESVCPICLKAFSAPEQRKEHMKTHMQLHKAYVDCFLSSTICPYCNKCYTSRSGKNRHVKSVHFDKFIANSDVVLPHAKLSKSKCIAIKKPESNFEIPAVEEPETKSNKIKVKTSLKCTPPNGIKKEDKNRKSLCCYVCPTHFRRHSNLTRHLRTVHADLLKFQCSICGVKFFSREHAGLHVPKTHKSRGIIIDLNRENGNTKISTSISVVSENKDIPKNLKKGNVEPSTSSSLTFPSNTLLEPQMASVNSKVQIVGQGVQNSKPPSHMYSCSVCSIDKFFTYGELKKHKKTRLHRRAYRESLHRPATHSNPQAQKNIICSVCNFPFNEEKGFVLHRMKHLVSEEDILHSIESGANHPYQCEICGLTIIGIRKIQFHLLWHTYTAKNRSRGNNPMYSSLHSKMNSDTCISSQRLQADPKKFVCFGCGTVFLNRNAFVKHKQINISQGASRCIVDKTATCLKYCLIHETELCYHTDGSVNNKFSSKSDENYNPVLTLDILPNGSTADNSDLRNTASCNGYAHPHTSSPHYLKSEKPNGTTTFPNIVLAYDSEKKISSLCQNYHKMDCSNDSDSIQKQLTCSLCGQINKTLREFKSHSCFLNGKSNKLSSLLGCNNDVESRTSVDSNYDSDDDLVKFCSTVNETTMKSYSLLIGKSNSDIKILRENFSNLLCLLIDDDQLMMKFGWGKKPIDSILDNILKCFGKQPLLEGNGITILDKLRHNIKLLLELCVKDTFTKSIKDLDSIDDTVKEMLTYFNSCPPMR